MLDEHLSPDTLEYREITIGEEKGEKKGEKLETVKEDAEEE